MAQNTQTSCFARGSGGRGHSSGGSYHSSGGRSYGGVGGYAYGGPLTPIYPYDYDDDYGLSYNSVLAHTLAQNKALKNQLASSALTESSQAGPSSG